MKILIPKISYSGSFVQRGLPIRLQRKLGHSQSRKKNSQNVKGQLDLQHQMGLPR